MCHLSIEVCEKKASSFFFSNPANQQKMKMTLCAVHTSTKATDVAQLLLLNKCRVTTSHVEYSGDPT